jgi:response regulator RpfG family c-di-GMP phosphodiesterase
MTSAKLPRILCVDDEPRVLDSLVLTLRRDYEVHIAVGGEEALKLLASNHNFALICSDMRMPGMTGAVLLNRVMQLYPEVTRILLTGEPGRDAAVNAVNEGQIFRFLTKPCPTDKLKSAIDAGISQHLLVSAERVLLQETLIGCIKALIDVLAITNPVAFGRASRVKRLAMEFAGDLGCRGFWQLEAAAMLSQLGYLSLPVELVEKLYYGEVLSPDEKVLASGVPEVANKLLGHIPRLEPVMQILAALNSPNDAKLSQGTINLGAKILSLVLDYDSLVAQGLSADSAIDQLKRRDKKHDTSMVEKLGARLGAGSTGGEEVRHLPLRLVTPGMIFMDDLRSEFGVLLVPRGFEASESFVSRMRNFGAKLLGEDVRVMTRHTPQA